MFIIEDIADAFDIARIEIYDFVVDGTECQNCGLMVGPLGDEFVPCTIIHAGDHGTWPICIDCVTPVLFPNEITLELFPSDDDED